MNKNPPLARSTALGLWTTLALFTAVVASRRLAGAYAGPLPNGPLTIAVFLAVTTSLLAWRLFRRHEPRGGTSTGDWLPEMIAWALPTLFSLVIAVQATPAQAGALIGIAVIGAVLLGVAILETTSWWQALMSDRVDADFRRVRCADHEVEQMVRTADPTSETCDTHLEEEPPGDDEVAEETTTQWMTRRQEAEGEAIEGTVRVEFTAGQREAIVHVTFCPPLSSLPEVEFECVDGEDWQIKAEAALAYGLRIQVRRSSMVAVEQSGTIAYLATSTRTLKAA
ncbi:MAG TPA: hypothetical protein VFG20_10110 [Planctomycetaceae bacterium]|jgi:hypothetical protein|nr:hypothetical protein [Planctomycetaceae bacterium]